MGKKTDKFIQEIIDIQNDCTEPIAAISQLAPKMKAVKDKMDDLDKRYQARGKKLGNKEGAEMDDDPEIMTIAGELSPLEKEWDKLLSKKVDLQDELRPLAKSLNTKIKNFETFVAKKKDAWFGSKKSVPQAEAFIKDSKDYQKLVTSMLSPSR